LPGRTLPSPYKVYACVLTAAVPSLSAPLVIRNALQTLQLFPLYQPSSLLALRILPPHLTVPLLDSVGAIVGGVVAVIVVIVSAVTVIVIAILVIKNNKLGSSIHQDMG